MTTLKLRIQSPVSHLSLALLLCGLACDSTTESTDKTKATPSAPSGTPPDAGDPPPVVGAVPTDPLPVVGVVPADPTRMLVLEAPQRTVPLVLTTELSADADSEEGKKLNFRTACVLGSGTYVDSNSGYTRRRDVAREGEPAKLHHTPFGGSQYYDAEPRLGDCDVWLTRRSPSSPDDSETLVAIACIRNGVLTHEGCTPYSPPATPGPLDPEAMSVMLVAAQPKQRERGDKRYALDLVLDARVDAPVSARWDLEVDMKCTAAGESAHLHQNVYGVDLDELRKGQSMRATVSQATKHEETLALPPERCDIAVTATGAEADPTHALGQWCYTDGASLRRGSCDAPGRPVRPPLSAALVPEVAGSMPTPALVPTVAMQTELGFAVTSFDVQSKGGNFPFSATVAVDVGELRDDKSMYLHFKSVCKVGSKTYIDTTLESLPKKGKSTGESVTLEEDLFGRHNKGMGAFGDCDHWLTFRDRFAGKLRQYRETLLATACTRAGVTTQTGCSPLPLGEAPGLMRPAAASVSVVSVDVEQHSVNDERYALDFVVDVTVNEAIRARWDLEATLKCKAGAETSEQTDGFLGSGLHELARGQTARQLLMSAYGKDETLAAPPETCDIEVIASRGKDDPVHSLGRWCYASGQALRGGRCPV